MLILFSQGVTWLWFSHPVLGMEARSARQRLLSDVVTPPRRCEAVIEVTATPTMQLSVGSSSANSSMQIPSTGEQVCQSPLSTTNSLKRKAQAQGSTDDPLPSHSAPRCDIDEHSHRIRFPMWARKKRQSLLLVGVEAMVRDLKVSCAAYDEIPDLDVQINAIKQLLDEIKMAS